MVRGARCDRRCSFLKEDQMVKLHFQEGKVQFEENLKMEIEVEMDVAEFSSMIMGAVNFRSLYDYDLATISNVERIGEVNALFISDQKPVASVYF